MNRNSKFLLGYQTWVAKNIRSPKWKSKDNILLCEYRTIVPSAHDCPEGSGLDYDIPNYRVRCVTNTKKIFKKGFRNYFDSSRAYFFGFSTLIIKENYILYFLLIAHCHVIILLPWYNFHLKKTKRKILLFYGMTLLYYKNIQLYAISIYLMPNYIQISNNLVP